MFNKEQSMILHLPNMNLNCNMFRKKNTNKIKENTMSFIYSISMDKCFDT